MPADSTATSVADGDLYDGSVHSIDVTFDQADFDAAIATYQDTGEKAWIEVTVTIEIAATGPGGVPDNVVRTVTENSRTLKFTSQGFEAE